MEIRRFGQSRLEQVIRNLKAGASQMGEGFAQANNGERGLRKQAIEDQNTSNRAPKVPLVCDVHIDLVTDTAQALVYPHQPTSDLE